MMKFTEEEKERIASNIYDIIMFMPEHKTSAIIDAVIATDSETGNLLKLKYF